MRMYYVFEVKDEMKSLYLDNPEGLFRVLNHIYYMHIEDINYGYNLFSQIIYPIDKDEVNKKIYLSFHNDLSYSKNRCEHVLNNLYKNDIGVLKVRSTHILLECNKDYCEFLKVLGSYKDNYFVCDFKDQDYFFLNRVKSIV